MFIRFVALLFFLSPLVINAASISNAGFIPAPLWFSRDTFFAGEIVRVYTVVYNGSDSDIRGTVEFLNGNAVIGSDDFSLAKGGRSQDIWIDWKAAEGEHRISARIVRARAAKAGGTEESIDLSLAAIPEARVSVDTDTDKDSVGNKADDDDDNDGISDRDEERAGTNSLVKDDAPKIGTNGDTVVYNANSFADTVADTISQKSADAGNVLSAYTESVRESGSALLEQKVAESRKEIERLRAAKSAEHNEIQKTESSEESAPQVSRAKQIADTESSRNFFTRMISPILSLLAKTGKLVDTGDGGEALSDKKNPAGTFLDAHTPFAYLKLFVYSTLGFIFRHGIFFYLILVLIAYYCMRVGLRFFQSRYFS